VRVVGTAPTELWELTRELGLSVLTDPVSQDVGLEGRHYVLEQSVCVAYHRHGNLSLRGIHPLFQGKTSA
jgi:hypothetical protein